jgi:hypothetical protein
MKSHPYLRAYMSGISVPTPLLLVALTLFSIARFVYDVPIPVERVIIFPMAIIPNLFGVWNVLHLARAHAHTCLWGFTAQSFLSSSPLSDFFSGVPWVS